MCHLLRAKSGPQETQADERVLRYLPSLEAFGAAEKDESSLAVAAHHDCSAGGLTAGRAGGDDHSARVHDLAGGQGGLEPRVEPEERVAARGQLLGRGDGSIVARFENL